MTDDVLNLSTEVERGPRVHSQHTPGPWKLDWKIAGGGAHPEFPLLHYVNINAPDETHDLHLTGYITKPNAYLIGAAPDMYAALRELVECKQLKDHIDAEDFSAASDEYIEYVRRKRQAWQAARDAIAKVKGFV